MTRTLADRHQQARLYAAQMRVRREMGDKYAHAKRHYIQKPDTRRLISEQLENA